MKVLILLLSVIFILTSGCGDSEENSENGNGERDDRGGRVERNIENPTTIETPPDPSSTTPTETKNACSAYTKTCQNDKECGEKYSKCLKPKAGKPTTTEVIICTRTQGTKEEKITLTLNEWKAASGDNNLLCDFLEFENNTEYLIQFATTVKDTCKNLREARKMELVKAGYNCAPKKEEPQPAEQPQPTEQPQQPE